MNNTYFKSKSGQEIQQNSEALKAFFTWAECICYGKVARDEEGKIIITTPSWNSVQTLLNMLKSLDEPRDVKHGKTQENDYFISFSDDWTN